MSTLIFATYAETSEELRHVSYLAESIRSFAGRFKTAAIWAYVPKELADSAMDMRETLTSLGVEVKTSAMPDASRAFYYAGKVFAAANAEAAAEGKTEVLAWMDEDTIVLQEPGDFALAQGVAFAYRPVMHNRSGSLYSEPPDAFWRRIYQVLAIADSSLFPMVTPADRQTIRAYFNAGLLVVRPQAQILRNWASSFEKLYTDSALVQMCEADVTKRIFLHQTALAGAVLNHLKRSEMTELSEQYNYPIFFEQQYDATREFGSIEDVVTLRYDVYFRNPDPAWARKLKGPPDQVTWLKTRLSADAAPDREQSR